MTDKNLIVMASVAGGLLLITVVLYSGWDFTATDFRPGSLLVQGLDPQKIGSITINKGDETITLAQQEDAFVVVEKANYPASLEKINDLLIDILEIRSAEKVTDSENNHAGLGVADDSDDAVTISFTDAEGKELVGLVKGKSRQRGSGAYVRLTGSNAVYGTEDYLSINTNATGYIDKELVKAKKKDIKRVEVTGATETYTIARNKEDKVTLRNVPEGKKADKSEFDTVFTALTNLSFSDVAPLDGFEASWDTTYTCELVSGLVYSLELALVDEKHYAKLSAKGPDVDRVQISRDESQEQLKEKEAILLAVDEANAFNEKHSGWVYEIASWNAEKMRKQFSELLKDKNDSDSSSD